MCLGFMHQLVTARLMHIQLGATLVSVLRPDAVLLLPPIHQVVTCCMLRASYSDTQQLYSMVYIRVMADLQISTSR